MIINVNSTDKLKKLKLTLEERHIFPFFFFLSDSFFIMEF